MLVVYCEYYALCIGYNEVLIFDGPIYTLVQKGRRAKVKNLESDKDAIRYINSYHSMPNTKRLVE